MFNTDTKIAKLFNALNKGAVLTPAQAKKRFGVMNLRAEASRIRAKGYTVTASQRKAGNGVVVTEYALTTKAKKAKHA